MVNVVGLRARLLIAVLSIATLALGSMPARADDVADAKQLVEKARLTLEKFAADPAMGGFRDAVKRARGVFVSPQVLRGAFIVGASGGSGVLLARDPSSGQVNIDHRHTMGGST